MSILIIEDDLKVQSFLKESLEAEFSPISVLSSFPTEEDLKAIQNEPQTIVLDRLLGTVDSKIGIGFLRRRFPQSTILILSAINGPAERSELLDLGADDYMGKPFSVVELKARIRALSRRGRQVGPMNYVQLDSTILDLLQRTINVGENRRNLSAKEFELFSVFAKHPGRVFSKLELMDRVWQTNLEIESNVLEVTMMNLRKKLTEIHSTVIISSKRNLGYWLET